MNIYVAAKWEERERAREIMIQLIEAGHIITYDWTQAVEQMSCEQALRDLHGVFEADALVLIAEHDLAYKGALVEMGMAIACGLPVYVLGHAIDSCIFMALPQVYRGLP